MRGQSTSLSICIPDSSLQVPSFGRPLSPGCPTDPMQVSTPNSAEMLPRTSRSTLSGPPSWDADTFASQPTGVWRIQPGTFIAFALDTSAIATNLPSDSLASQIAYEFPVRRYVGLVTNSYVYHLDDTQDEETRIEELVVNFVSAIPPPEIELEDHWMAIEPSMASMPPPLRTTTLFPWTDRMLWTTSGTRLMVQRLHESSLRFALHEDEFVRFENQVSHDHTELDTLRVPGYSVPAQVWRDIREGDCPADPTGFVEEVDCLQSLLTEVWGEQQAL